LRYVKDGVDRMPLFFVEVIFKRRFITEAGTIINLLITVAFVLSVVLAGVIAMFIAKKRMETTLRESEDKYKILTEISLTGIFIHHDAKFQFVNKKFTEISGYDSGELLEIEFWKLVHPEDREAMKWLRSNTFEEETIPSHYEVRVLKKDGEIIWGEMMLTRIEYKGKPAVMGNILDITDRKRLEEESKAHLAELRRVSNQLSTIEEKSRRTFAKSLHDQIIQNLAVISMGLTQIRHLTSPEDQNLLSKVADTKLLVDATISSTRNITADLFPSLLDDMGLIAALSWHAEAFSNGHDIKVNINSDELKGRLAQETELILFRTVQEALHNVAKHARATRVAVSLKQKGKNLQVTISDDGVGFDPSILTTPGEGSGIGITLMKERIASLDGVFEIDSSKGTTIRIEVPLIEE
jgi:PAS domain S-box-containing protein